MRYVLVISPWPLREQFLSSLLVGFQEVLHRRQGDVPLSMDVLPLRGFTVGVTADRRGEDQAVMLRRLGVDVLLGPSMATLPPVDESTLRAITESLIASPPDDLVANTGFGIRAWLSLAKDWGLETDLLQGLASRTRIAARGPKAVGALRSAGLPVWWRAPDEQLATVGRHLVETGIAGRRVAVQLHGDDRQEITAMLRAASAEVIEVPVYRWDLPRDAERPARIVEAAVAGTLDGITFTAGPQIRNLMVIARRLGLADDFLEACEGRVLVACVGPVCAAVATEEGITRSLVPEQWRLGSLVRTLGDALMGRCWLLVWQGHQARIQGSVAVVQDREISLDADQRSLLDALRQADLDSAGPVSADAGVLAALRTSLGPLGGAVVADSEGWRLASGSRQAVLSGG
jgi:uroporphyrinogen-III synthase